MTRLSRGLMWLLLVPYFAVASLNVPPWIGERRESANRTNAQLVLSLVFAFTVLNLLSLTGTLHQFGNVSPMWIGLATVVPPMIAISLLLNRERERHYRALYRSMPTWERVAFGSTTLGFALLMIWLFFKKA